MRRHLIGTGVIIVLAGLFTAVFSGPLFRFTPKASPEIERAVNAADDLDRYLADAEANVPRLKKDLAKGIVWARADKSRTPYSIVYLHGFSASRGESAPLFDEVGAEIGANVFYSRFTAHGLDDQGESFATLTAQNLIDDAREALAIGRRLGEQVILVGMSTGAALALNLVHENHNASDLAALILISPNFQPADARSRYLSGPFGSRLARVALGSHRGFTAENEKHRYLWTTNYRSEGIAAMMDIVNSAAFMDLSGLRVPTLTLYTHKDKVVSVPLIESRHADIGANIKKIVDLPQARGHLLAGEAVSGDVVKFAKAEIMTFLNEAEIRSVGPNAASAR